METSVFASHDCLFSYKKKQQNNQFTNLKYITDEIILHMTGWQHFGLDHYFITRISLDMGSRRNEMNLTLKRQPHKMVKHTQTIRPQ